MQVVGLTNVVAISAGGLHNLALKGDGTVWAWGSNSVGQLGKATPAQSTVASQVPGLTGVTAVGAGALPQPRRPGRGRGRLLGLERLGPAG